MSVTTNQTERLLKGNLTFTQLGFSLLLTRLKSVYTRDPKPETLHYCTDEINKFLDRFSSIMGADYSIISKL